MARSTYMDREQAFRVLEDYAGRLGECTFAARGSRFSIPAEDGEELRRAIDTILLYADDKMLLSDRIQQKIRDALWHEAHDVMDSIFESVIEAVEEAVGK